MKDKSIHIIGGTGQMGNWLKNFLESQGFVVGVSGRKSDLESIKIADIVFISVSLDIAPKVIQDTSRIIKKDVVLIDLSSIQSQTTKALQKSKHPSIGLHLLFGPTVSSIQDQKIIVCDVKTDKLINSILDVFSKSGARLFKMSAKEHDILMAHIQSLTHFINLVFSETLDKNKINLNNISTPVFLAQLSAINRVVVQEPELLSKIQLENPFYLKVLESFLENQQQFIKLIKSHDFNKINKKIDSIHQKVESTPKISIKSKSEKEKPLSKLKGKLNVGYLGPEGTFSHQALISITSKEQNMVALKTINDIFENVSKGNIDYGLVPAENSIEGTIRETLDFLVDYDLKINLGVDLIVHQNLLSKQKDLKKITTVYSHAQGIAQSRIWLNENLPRATIQTSSSTVSAITEIDKQDVAIIASEAAAKKYKLNILAKAIESNKNNITKFYLISKKSENLNPMSKKTVLFLTVFNRVGVLRDILGVFADSDINLSKLESRPSKEKLWDYYFFIEVEVTQKDERLIQALNILKQYCPVIKILGEV